MKNLLKKLFKSENKIDVITWDGKSKKKMSKFLDKHNVKYFFMDQDFKNDGTPITEKHMLYIDDLYGYIPVGYTIRMVNEYFLLKRI